MLLSNFNTRIFLSYKHLSFFKTKLVSHSITVRSYCNFLKPFPVNVVKLMERAMQKKVSQQLLFCYSSFLRYCQTVVSDSYKWASYKKSFGCRQVVVNGGRRISASGGWRWIYFGWWRVVVGGNAYILADGWLHTLV